MRVKVGKAVHWEPHRRGGGRRVPVYYEYHCPRCGYLLGRAYVGEPAGDVYEWTPEAGRGRQVPPEEALPATVDCGRCKTSGLAVRGTFYT